jgi:hypothetical protein
MYVIQRNYRVAFRNILTWPLTAGLEAYQEHRLGRSAIRFLAGVVLLAGGLFLWSRLAYLFTLKIVDSEWVAYTLAIIFGLIVCPIVTALAMPRHG